MDGDRGILPGFAGQARYNPETVQAVHIPQRHSDRHRVQNPADLCRLEQIRKPDLVFVWKIHYFPRLISRGELNLAKESLMKRCTVLGLGLLLMALATGCCGQPFGNFGNPGYGAGAAYYPMNQGTAYNVAPYGGNSCGCAY